MRTARALAIACCFWVVVCAAQTPPRDALNLDGEWQFRADPQRVGAAAGWQKHFEPGRTMRVPGVWQAQGLGEPRSFLRNDYVGLGWYEKLVDVPAAWRGKAAVLHISGASRLTKAYVNGELAGTHDGFSTPFDFDVTKLLRPGAPNTIVIAVDNDWPKTAPVIAGGRDISKPIGFLMYQANWGGIYGHVQLVAHDDPYIEDAYVVPDLRRGSARVHVRAKSVAASGTFDVKGKVVGAAAAAHAGSGSVTLRAGQAAEAQFDVAIPNARTWSPEDPFLYLLTVQVKGGGEFERGFGMREFAMEGERLLLNGKPYFLRGYGDLDVEPMTGVPPVTVEEHTQRFRIAKQFGFNYVRLHSRMPTPEMLEAADRVGMLISYEAHVVYAEFLLPHQEFVGRELERMVAVTRGHPSVFSVDMGNEMDPDRDFTAETRPQFLSLLNSLRGKAKAIDPTLIVFGSDGFHIPPSDLASPMRGIVPGVVNLGHEFGGYPCSLPNPALISRFTGMMTPFWLRDIEQWVSKNGLADVYPALIRDSERLQWESHKYKIERLRANGHFSGYQLWAMTDAPSGVEGGPFEEGILDYFWQPKTIGPERYREFQTESALLIDREPQERTFWLDRGTDVRVSLSHFGSALQNARLEWRAVDAETGVEVAHGGRQSIAAEPGRVTEIATIHIAPAEHDKPMHIRLEAKLAGADVANEWEFWGYPAERISPTKGAVASEMRAAAVGRLYPSIAAWDGGSSHPKLVVASSVTQSVFDYVVAGGSAVIFMDKGTVDTPRDVNYFPDFVRWSPKAWGTRIEQHPFAARFVERGVMDMQFFDLMQDSYGLSEQWMVGAESGRLHPVMWAIRTVPGSLEKLGFVYEFRVGKGKVLLVSLNVEPNLDEAHPAAMYFFDQALRYASSSDFAPKDELTSQQFSQFAFVAYR
jgi:beta-galactosidase